MYLKTCLGIISKHIHSGPIPATNRPRPNTHNTSTLFIYSQRLMWA